MAARQATKRTVARVYYAEPERAHTEQSWVRCERLESSVPLEQCEQCPHLSRVDTGRDGKPVAVHCPGGEKDAAEASTSGTKLPHVPISDLMTRDVLCVRPSLSIDALIELFVETGLRAVPVVDRDGVLLGMVSESDAMLEVHARAPTADNASNPNARTARPMRNAECIMSPLPIALPENTPVSRAAAVMVFEHASRVVVVSPVGDVVGMLSAVDILFWLAQKDGYLVTMTEHKSP